MPTIVDILTAMSRITSYYVELSMKESLITSRLELYRIMKLKQFEKQESKLRWRYIHTIIHVARRYV